MSLGVVVIGRNEGQRLVNCLESIKDYSPVVYVDSGSSDDSIKNAQALGAGIVELDLSIPFSAARARNAGLEYLLKHQPDLEFVFFVDGDCVVAPAWLATAVKHLQTDTKLAVVCGRRKEIHPDASIYNTLCDMEWNTAIGLAGACGGDAVYKVSVLKQIGGFDPGFIAGEEPELCFRIRHAGFFIERLDADMTFHDAAMVRFSQWWRRTERSGHAYFLGWSKHGGGPDEKFYAKDVRSICAWTSIYVFFTLLALVSWSLIPAIVLVILFILQVIRLAARLEQRFLSYSIKVKLFYAGSMMLGKLPQALGLFRALRKQQKGEQATLVEYK